MKSFLGEHGLGRGVVFDPIKAVSRMLTMPGGGYVAPASASTIAGQTLPPPPTIPPAPAPTIAQATPPTAPTPSAPVNMPTADSPAVTAAGNKAAGAIAKRPGRLSTVLTTARKTASAADDTLAGSSLYAKKTLG